MKFFGKVFLMLAAAAAAGSLFADGIQIRNGESLAFLGDSITQQGWSKPYGYVHLVVEGLKSAGVEVKPIPAGISGHKSTNMNARMEKDVTAKKAQWMTLSCGVNDVWHGKNGVPLEQYKKEVTQIFDKADKAGIKVVVLTPTMIREDPEGALNKQLVPYLEFLRAAAKERNYLIADLNADMQKAIADAKAKNPNRKGLLLTVDGVHMNAAGDEMMASGILKALGLSDAQLAAAKNAWQKIPNAKSFGQIAFSFEDARKIEAAAAAAKVSPAEFIRSAALEKAK